nr:crosslink repair DNA glycosylase YcaQ family protein [Pseudarthrobacter psychrotolerans]
MPPGPALPPTRAEALSELVRRYFTSRGPATVKDCADWSGLTMADVRLGLQQCLAAAPETLATSVIDGVVHYFDAGADGSGGAGPASGPRLDLIQCYDEYVMDIQPPGTIWVAARRRSRLPGRPCMWCCWTGGWPALGGTHVRRPL